MLFSFMGEYGRVIQAYYDGQDLVIRKSRLFSFRNSPATTLGLFVRHVANTPVGDTTTPEADTKAAERLYSELKCRDRCPSRESKDIHQRFTETTIHRNSRCIGTT